MGTRIDYTKYSKVNPLTVIKDMDKTLENYKSLGKDYKIYDFEISTRNIPICVLSHEYNPSRSKFLKHLLNQNVERKYFIFVYENQKEKYKDFKNVIYIPDSEYVLGLPHKRNKVLEFARQNNYKDIFMIEDDCFNFCLPVGYQHEGKVVYKPFKVNYDLFFDIWEDIINKNELKFSGLDQNTSFAFRIKDNLINEYANLCQCVHINLDMNLNYDITSGWDDWDFNLQVFVNKFKNGNIHLSYFTPALRDGISVESNSLNKLKERCIKNSTLLINKWGDFLVSKDERKDLFNARPNTRAIKQIIELNLNPKDFIQIHKEKAKEIIKEAKCQN